MLCAWPGQALQLQLRLPSRKDHWAGVIAAPMAPCQALLDSGRGQLLGDRACGAVGVALSPAMGSFCLPLSLRTTLAESSVARLSHGSVLWTLGGGCPFGHVLKRCVFIMACRSRCAYWYLVTYWDHGLLRNSSMCRSRCASERKRAHYAALDSFNKAASLLILYTDHVLPVRQQRCCYYR